MRLSEKFGFLADPGFFFHRIAPKLVANILVNINSGVLGVLLKIFFGDPISTLSTLEYFGTERIIGAIFLHQDNASLG